MEGAIREVLSRECHVDGRFWNNERLRCFGTINDEVLSYAGLSTMIS